MSNKDSEKIINAILVKLNNTTDYSKLNENDKTKYVLEMLKKNKLIYTKESQELIDIYNLQSCIDEMKEILEIIYNSNLYASNQIKLQRINKNLKNIFLNAE
jgi:phosphoenolpyruvate carboxylase